MMKKTRDMDTHSNYSEAIRSYEITVNEKNQEIQTLYEELQQLRTSTQREFKLMSNAFHELGSRIN